MNDEAYKVTVAKDLEDLIPGFMRNRNKELETLKVALAAADFEQLRQLGHRMKGVGNSYGFARSRSSARRSRTGRAAGPGVARGKYCAVQGLPVEGADRV